jgi:hypothetical protein
VAPASTEAAPQAAHQHLHGDDAEQQAHQPTDHLFLEFPQGSAQGHRHPQDCVDPQREKGDHAAEGQASLPGGGGIRHHQGDGPRPSQQQQPDRHHSQAVGVGLDVGLAHLHFFDQAQADRQQDQATSDAEGIESDSEQIQKGLTPPAGRQQGDKEREHRQTADLPHPTGIAPAALATTGSTPIGELIPSRPTAVLIRELRRGSS